MNPCIEKTLNIMNEIGSVVIEKGWLFINSTFFLTVIATFAAAFAGAWGAQFIAERSRKSSETLKALRGANAAITTAHSISNKCLSAKKTHIKSLKESLEKQKSEFNQFEEDRKNGLITGPLIFQFKADLQELPLLVLPIELLEKLVFEQISVNSRTLSLTISLVDSLQSLNISIRNRNEFIEELREKVHIVGYDLLSICLINRVRLDWFLKIGCIQLQSAPRNG